MGKDKLDSGVRRVTYPPDVSMCSLRVNGEMPVYYDLRNKEHLSSQATRNTGMFININPV